MCLEAETFSEKNKIEDDYQDIFGTCIFVAVYILYCLTIFIGCI